MPGSPRLIPVPGKEFQNIFPIRVPEEVLILPLLLSSSSVFSCSLLRFLSCSGQANAVAGMVEGKKLVIVGSSFIGMEVLLFSPVLFYSFILLS